MKKLLIIPAILATVFTAAVAMGVDSSVVAAKTEAEKTSSDFDYCKDGNRLFSLSHEDTIGYQNIKDADEQKNGIVIAHRYKVVAFYESFHYLDSENVRQVPLFYEPHTTVYIFIKDEYASQPWITCSKKLDVLGKFNILITEHMSNSIKISKVDSAYNEFEKLNPGQKNDFLKGLVSGLELPKSEEYRRYEHSSTSLFALFGIDYIKAALKDSKEIDKFFFYCVVDAAKNPDFSVVHIVDLSNFIKNK
jgi:hypothetical protein